MPVDVQGAAEEIAFIPASQRQAAQPAVDDSIIIVGQRQKKRKRTKKLDTDESPMPDRTDQETKKAKVEDGVIELFDYATAPNILDDEPEAKPDRKVQRKRQKTKGMLQTLSITSFVYRDHQEACWSTVTSLHHQGTGVRSRAETHLARSDELVFQYPRICFWNRIIIRSNPLNHAFVGAVASISLTACSLRG